MTLDLNPATSLSKGNNQRRASGPTEQDTSAFGQTFSGLLQRGQASVEREMEAADLNATPANSGIKGGPDTGHIHSVSNELELVAYREFATHHAFSFQAVGLFGRSTVPSVELEGQQTQDRADGSSLLSGIDTDLGTHRDVRTSTMMIPAGVPTPSLIGVTPYVNSAGNGAQVSHSALVRGSDMQALDARASVALSANENQDSDVRRQAKLIASRIATSVARAGVTRIEISLGLDGRKLNVRIRAGGLAKTDIAALEANVKSLLKEFGFEIGSIVIEYKNVDSDRLISKGLQDGRN